MSILLLTIAMGGHSEEPDRWFDGEVLGFSIEAFLFLLALTVILFAIGYLIKRIWQKK